MKKVKPQALEKMLSVKFISTPLLESCQTWYSGRLRRSDDYFDIQYTWSNCCYEYRCCSFNIFQFLFLKVAKLCTMNAHREKMLHIDFQLIWSKKKVKMLGFFLSDVYLLSYDWLIDWLIIFYSYELVIRAIVSLWFPETWTMTRRETEGHSSRWWKP